MPPANGGRSRCDQGPHHPPDASDRAELREETGLIAGNLRHIGHLLQAPGFSRQGYDVFLATALTQGAAAPEASEGDIFARAFPWPEVQRMIAAGTINDATTIAVLGLLMLSGVLPRA